MVARMPLEDRLRPSDVFVAVRHHDGAANGKAQRGVNNYLPQAGGGGHPLPHVDSSCVVPKHPV